eukprot:SAG31_NODE_180_length_21118_cov_62.152671_12_plen_97_part_00
MVARVVTVHSGATAVGRARSSCLARAARSHHRSMQQAAQQLYILISGYACRPQQGRSAPYVLSCVLNYLFHVPSFKSSMRAPCIYMAHYATATQAL